MHFTALLSRLFVVVSLSTAATLGAATATNPPAVSGQGDTTAQLAALRTGRAVDAVLNFVRAYEPNELGLTKDKSDELFMEFKFSLMFPLLGDYGDHAKLIAAPRWRVGYFDSKHTALLFSATIRGGQYIWTRPSAPVVEKRFNPQVFTRFWFVNDGEVKSDRYFDLLLYGHESNGQSISTLSGFNQQLDIYRKLEAEPDTPGAYDDARRAARDAISRGWDYVGAEFSWGWQSQVTVKNKVLPISHVARMKVRHFLANGFLQQGAEEYNDWEGDGPRHHRADYDGLMFQYTSGLRWIAEGVPVFTGRYTLTYTTGLAQPFQHSTLEIDLGATAWGKPFSFWFRRGYNSDLIDYYKLTQSFGGKLSIWQF